MFDLVPDDPVLNDTTTSIGERIRHIRYRIEQACVRAGRDPDEVELVAVTKTHPIAVVHEAFNAGLRHFGENRVQELKLKADAFPGQIQGGEITWHMIGHIQRNKAKEVVTFADMVHSLDSLRLAKELNRRAGDAARVLPCLVQVNVSGESSKYGLEPAEVPALMGALASFKHLQIRGFMTLAAPAENPETIRPQFKLLRSLLEEIRAAHGGDASLTCLSMGMSGDFEVAIEEGATHVRLGSALFGART